VSSKRTGISIDAIRYYEGVRLLRVPLRTTSGRRIYSDSDVRILIIIRRARELGFTIDQIRVFFRLGVPGDAPCEEFRHLILSQINNVRAKISELAETERVLVRAIAHCSGNAAPRCLAPDFLFGDPKEVIGTPTGTEGPLPP
jgi:MerR family transcriptional regulator, mercuric resistance operon regulatory protein